MEFIYPEKIQFPFDEVCIKIVKALEERNFDVHGMKVSFNTYGSGEQHMRYVSEVCAEDWSIKFGRSQSLMSDGHFFNIAAVSEISANKKLIRVYSDEDAPTLYVYVGNDWSADRFGFMHNTHISAKLYNEPRTYIKYSGSRHRHGERPSTLTFDSDIGREYGLIEGDAESYKTDEIFEQFRAFLQDVVLSTILDNEIPPPVIMFPDEETIPFPDSFGTIFCFADNTEAGRVEEGKVDPNNFIPAKRYAMSQSWRLCPWEVINDGSFPKCAYDAFVWCGIGDIADSSGKPIKITNLKVPGSFRHGARCVLKVSPKKANDVFIADYGEYEKCRERIRSKIEEESSNSKYREYPRSQFNKDEVSELYRCVARTLIPIHEYIGGFSEPVILIRRELGFDEVEIASYHKSDY